MLLVPFALGDHRVSQDTARPRMQRHRCPAEVLAGLPHLLVAKVQLSALAFPRTHKIRFSDEDFRAFVHRVQNFITIRITSSSVQSLNRDEAVTSATKVLAILSTVQFLVHS